MAPEGRYRLSDEMNTMAGGPERRRFLELFFGTGVAASLASFFYPILRYVIPPQTAELNSDTVLAGRIGDLQPNTGKIFRFGNYPGLLIRTSENKYLALTATCTHLNCTVQYRGDLHAIWCACHNGLYGLDGRNISGPPPRPLERYDVSLKGDEIYVRRRETS
jgi:cytochrome b6-f complex iron-sulfur subunit